MASNYKEIPNGEGMKQLLMISTTGHYQNIPYRILIRQNRSSYIYLTKDLSGMIILIMTCGRNHQ